MLQKIKTDNPSKRVETGPVQFDDDWPGVFIRGDNAGYYAMCLRQLLEDIEDSGDEFTSDAISKIALKGLLRDLEGSDIRNIPEDER